MDQLEKLAACLRICGPEPTQHRMAPEMCPILLDQWHNSKLAPKKEPIYRRSDGN